MSERSPPQTYLERDVRDLSQVADLVSFRNVLHLAALRTARLLNQSELARDARLPASTVTRYLGLLETSFVLARLTPFLQSRAALLMRAARVGQGPERIDPVDRSFAGSADVDRWNGSVPV